MRLQLMIAGYFIVEPMDFFSVSGKQFRPWSDAAFAHTLGLIGHGELTFTSFLANSADDKLIFASYFFPRKIGFAILCKLSPVETICMKCPNLFYWKNKKNISMYRLLTFLPSMDSN